MKNVINSPSRQSAVDSCAQFLSYFPYRHAAIVQMGGGGWGFVTGKTMARINNVARSGCKVWLVSK